MDLHPNLPEAVVNGSNGHPNGSTRLEPMLIRLPPHLADSLRRLARATRVRQSDYLREAVSDLLEKYRHLQGSMTEDS